jgi:predicted Rossmann fold nucleotide-binding protein DprA/Smf involved in DNA uptake
VPSASAVVPRLQRDEQLVWNVLADGGIPVDAMTDRTSLPASRVLAAITALELAGLVEATANGELRRRAR